MAAAGGRGEAVEGRGGQSEAKHADPLTAGVVICLVDGVPYTKQNVIVSLVKQFVTFC